MGKTILLIKLKIVLKLHLVIHTHTKIKELNVHDNKEIYQQKK